MPIAPFPFNITIVRGDDCPLQWTFSRDGVLEDQSLTSFWLTIKSSYSDLDADAYVQLDPADFTVGGTSNATVTALIPRTATIDMPAGEYYIDLQAEANSLLETRGLGKCVVIDHVTQRTT